MGIDEKIAKALEAELIAKGKLVEGGWKSLELMAYRDQSPALRDEFRNCFFAGAFHTFHSMLSMMSSDEEPTEEDVNRMSKLHEELETFYLAFKLKHGIPD